MGATLFVFGCLVASGLAASAVLPNNILATRNTLRRLPNQCASASAASTVMNMGEDDTLCAATLPTPTWHPPSREEMLSTLESKEFDVLVIGGGATGAGVAMDAVTRGLSVACVERGDFASATSSRSTKLIHGGLRYLAQAFQSKLPPRTLLDVFRNLRFEPDYLRIVSADLKERAWMIKSAPFMAQALPMLVPLYRWWELPLFWVVGTLYDLIAGGGRGVPPSRLISPEEARFEVPSLREANDAGQQLVGGLVIYDGQQNDARMNLHIILTAIRAGASCVSYAELSSLIKEGQTVRGAVVVDRRTGRRMEVRAKQVVNACGVFSDTVRKMADPDCTPIMVPSYGTHIVLPDYSGSQRMGMVWFTEDGRVLYLLPWEGSTIAGTTDSPGDISFAPESSRADVDFILRECNRVVREVQGPELVRAAWAGIRPLVRKPGSPVGDTKSLSRDHVVEELAGGLVTVAGGKWTTYRLMAQDAMDRCVASNPRLAHAGECVSKSLQLIGCDETGEVCEQSYDRIVATLRSQVGMDRDMAKHLRFNYGTRALQLVELAQAEPARFCQRELSSGRLQFRRLHPQYPHLEAEVAFACRHEFALTSSDVLAQRTRLAFLDSTAALDALPRVVEIMTLERGWSPAEAAADMEEAKQFLKTMSLPGIPAPRRPSPPAPTPPTVAAMATEAVATDRS